jgi:hypothetical protein
MRRIGMTVFGLLLATAAGATTHHVPGEYATIQSAVNACVPGDSVEVACGTYGGAITITTSGITLRGATPEADCVTVDGEGANRTLYVNGFSTPVTGLVVEGMTFTGATQYATYVGASSVDFRHCSFRDITNSGGNGAGVYLVDPATDVHFTQCSFENNTSPGDAGRGGALFAWGVQPLTFDGCVFFGNSAGKGGAVFLATVDATFTQCTFSENSGSMGTLTAGAIHAESSNLGLQGCIVAFSPAGRAVYLTGSSVVTAQCCDIHGNSNGDWIGDLAGLEGLDGNFSADPQFCGVAGELNLGLQSDSPCVDANHPQGGGTCATIGAMPVGCQETMTQDRSWGAVKRLFF